MELKSGVSMVCLFIEDTFVLLKFTMLSEYIFIGGTVAGLLWMRKTQPIRERPIKVSLREKVEFSIKTFSAKTSSLKLDIYILL